MAGLVEAVPDDALGRPTPCEQYTVGDLLDHVNGFALAFTAAAVKEPLDGAPAGVAANLPPTGAPSSPAGSTRWPRRGGIPRPGPA